MADKDEVLGEEENGFNDNQAPVGDANLWDEAADDDDDDLDEDDDDDDLDEDEDDVDDQDDE